MTPPNAAGVAAVRDSCAPPVGGVPATAVREVGRQAVLRGVVRRSDAPVAGAYVRLLDGSGEFAAEVVTDDAGGFCFYAAPGAWTVRTLAPRAAATDVGVTASAGAVAEVSVELAS